ncbi:MAG TPA: hypothetical protein PKK69_04010 [Ferruginibacter sp.]|nr:hypothetical protein [Ferruginibacter sp.]
MKKLYFVVCLLLTGMIAKSQDIDDIAEMISQNKIADAKNAIDRYLLDAKNAGKADAWYFKAHVYNTLSSDGKTADMDAYNYKNEAFQAYQKYQQLEPKDIRLKLEGGGYESYLGLYGGFYDLGAKFYNAKNYEGAFNSFRKAGEVKDYILKKGYEYPQYKLYALDTSLVMNTATAAMQAKKEDDAVIYYRNLTDANVGGPDYEHVYEYLVEYYNKKSDAGNLQVMLDKAKKFYPKNEYWLDVELKAVSQKGTRADLLAKYDELVKQNPDNFRLHYNYAVELYNDLYNRDNHVALENTALRQKLEEILPATIALEKDHEATMLQTNHYFNYAADLLKASNDIKSTKPEEVKKKTELKAQANKNMDACIANAEKLVAFFEGLPSMKPVQKANYKIVLGYLSDIYSLKNNAKKAAEYDAKNKAADKL